MKTTEQKIEKSKRKVEKKAAKKALKKERHAVLARMFETPPADPNKPSGDKPNLARMHMSVVKPELMKKDTTTGDFPGGQGLANRGQNAPREKGPIYQVHMPDHGDGKVYGSTATKAVKKAVKYMAMYGKALEDMIAGGKPPEKPGEQSPVRKALDLEHVGGPLTFKG